MYGEVVLLYHYCTYCISVLAQFSTFCLLNFWFTNMILCALSAVYSHVVCDFSVYVTVLLQGSLREVRQWQACRKHLGQTMLSAQGCGFTAS